jgi:hypothetical protein
VLSNLSVSLLVLTFSHRTFSDVFKYSFLHEAAPIQLPSSNSSQILGVSITAFSTFLFILSSIASSPLLIILVGFIPVVTKCQQKQFMGTEIHSGSWFQRVQSMVACPYIKTEHDGSQSLWKRTFLIP